MNPVVGAALLLGLAGLFGCMWILAGKIDSHMRETTRILVESNEMILARLDRLSNLPDHESEALAAVLLERSESSLGLPANRLKGDSYDQARVVEHRHQGAVPST